MAGYIGSKSSVTLVDGYSEAEADAEFVNDPNDVITVSGSNVGIGTSTFGATYDKLAVAGGINMQDDYAGKLEIGRYSSGVPNSYIKLGANSNSLRFTNKNDSADLLTIENGGNVGIGTVSPSNQLHLQKSADTGVVIENSAASMATLSLLATGAGRVRSSGVLIFDTGGATERMRIDASGRVTMPSQPAFMVNPNSTQENIAPNGQRTITFDVERFDQGGNFSSNSFTAPITGKYQLNVELRLDNVDTAATYYHLYLVTSNKTYHNIIQPRFTSDPAYWSLSTSVLADMDANDTAFVQLYQANGATQTDINNDSNFSGYLVA